MLCENDSIISESETVAKIFKKYLNEIADGIGFNDPIPENFDKDDIFVSMIKRYDDHPSIVTIKKKYSCQSILLRMIEKWKYALYNGNMVGSIAIDISRAFDSLPHGLL